MSGLAPDGARNDEHFRVHRYAVRVTFRADTLRREQARTFGPYRRDGRVRWRNYRRPLKIACAKSFVELLAEHMDAHRAEISGVNGMMLGPRAGGAPS